jgi:hypothetical protein
MYTLLHISDLHRSPHDPIDNAQLLSALLFDRDRYLLESPQVASPNAAIVSGDIIQGVPLNFSGYAAELDKQYEVAHDFLVRLADRFFGGDRTKIVIVPGNHDVCWNTAFSAMTALDPETPPLKVSADSFQAKSDLRWDWKSRKIHRITNQDIYKRRLDLYWRFTEGFYANSGLKFPIDRHRGFNLFELDNGRIVVAALESVYGNDCFCRQASIERNVLSDCALTIRDLEKQPLLKMAAWHHSFQGPPHGDDYMDINAVHEMIGNGFRLGFHGHQHQADASAYSIHLPEELSMGISSAGSLCAGARELPKGVNREYNLVVIDEKYSSARIHVREMTQGNHFGKCGRGAFRIDGFTRIGWNLPVQQGASHPATGKQFDAALIIQAEDFLKSGKPEKAKEILATLGEEVSGHPRNLYISALQSVGDWPQLAKVLTSPHSTEEFLLLFRALTNIKSYVEAEKLLDSSQEYGIATNIANELRSEIKMRNLMSNSK